jgi:hypothetical protein
MVNRIRKKISCVSDQRCKTSVLKYSVVPQILLRTSWCADRGVLRHEFAWIAHRHEITDRDEAFKKAADGIPSISWIVM